MGSRPLLHNSTPDGSVTVPASEGQAPRRHLVPLPVCAALIHRASSAHASPPPPWCPPLESPLRGAPTSKRYPQRGAPIQPQPRIDRAGALGGGCCEPRFRLTLRGMGAARWPFVGRWWRLLVHVIQVVQRRARRTTLSFLPRPPVPVRDCSPAAAWRLPSADSAPAPSAPWGSHPRTSSPTVVHQCAPRDRDFAPLRTQRRDPL